MTSPVLDAVLASFDHHWLTPRELAMRYNRSMTTIHRWIYDGTLSESGFTILQFSSSHPHRRPRGITYIRINSGTL